MATSLQIRTVAIIGWYAAFIHITCDVPGTHHTDGYGG